MSEQAPSVLERVEVMPDLNKNILCSGTGHYTGRDKLIHGEMKEPAEWMIRHACERCGHSQQRPVCDFFKEHGMTDDRMVSCSKCAHKDIAPNFFTVLRKL